MRVPNNEILWVTYCVDGTMRWVVTSKQARDYYFLYKVGAKVLEKIGRAKSPDELEEKYLKGWCEMGN